MREIKVKHFGPIQNGFADNDGFLKIDKVTLFIGNQGTGKSSIAKLISTLSWIEKALFQGKIKKSEITLYNRFQKKYCAFQGIDGYFQKNTFIEYRGEAYHIVYKQGKASIKEIKDKTNFRVPKITYIPAERNFISAVERPEKAKGLPEMLLTFLEEYEKARQELNEAIALPINDTRFEFQKQNKISYVIGNGYRLRLSKASSGQQSLIPLYLVLNYLSGTLGNEQDNSKSGLSSEEQRRIRLRAESIINNKTFSEEVKDSLLGILSKQFTNSYLINILEEIEQNLFPESQKSLLFKVLEFTNANALNELIITTHSPYIINYLTLAMKGEDVLQLIKKSKNATDYIKQLEKIIPEKACTTGDMVRIYEMNSLGNIIHLENSYGVISDNNFLNNFLATNNKDFDELLAIEEAVCP